MAIARAFHLPNMPRIQASIGLSIPEASFISVDRAWRPLRALVTDPSGGRVVGDERAALLTEHGADTSLLSQEHVQGHTILEGHQGSGSQLGRDALHGISGEVGFGTVDVGDLDAIELAEARVRVVSLWGVGIIGGGDGSASAGRGVIDSTLGG